MDTLVDIAKRQGTADAKNQRPMKVNPHWPPEARKAYRAAYIRANDSQYS